MNRREKEYQKLVLAERELRDSIVLQLPKVASGFSTGFFTIEGHWASKEGIAILARARDVSEHAERLGLESAVATEIISAFDHANDMNDEHRLGPIRLAETLLERIRLLPGVSGSADQQPHTPP